MSARHMHVVDRPLCEMDASVEDRLCIQSHYAAIGNAAYCVAVVTAIPLAFHFFGMFGAVMGALSAVNITIFLAAVARGDLSITWTVLTLSFSVPAIGSIIYPGEQATPFGIAGLLMVAVAVVLRGNACQ